MRDKILLGTTLRSRDTENRNVFGIFFVKNLKSFEKGVDICVVMVYNVVTEQERMLK